MATFTAFRSLMRLHDPEHSNYDLCPDNFGHIGVNTTGLYGKQQELGATRRQCEV